MVGDGYVGKTWLLYVYTTGHFPREFVPTVFDNHSPNVMWNGCPYLIGLWDTAGQAEYDRLRPLSYPQTDVFFLCFAVNDRRSFERVKSKWLEEINYHCPHAVHLLVGLKCDLIDDDESEEDFVTQEEAEELAEEIGAYKYVQTSAMNEINVKEPFNEAIAAFNEVDPYDDGNINGGEEKHTCRDFFLFGTFFNYLYDSITGLISLADLVTDVIVMNDFYQKGRTEFFVISLIIIIMAQFGYCFCFVGKYGNWGKEERYKYFLLFFSVLPIAPFLGFVFYLTSHRDKWLSKQLKKRFNLYIDNYVPNKDDSPIIRFIEEKMTKHMGFMLGKSYFFLLSIQLVFIQRHLLRHFRRASCK